MNIAVRVFKLEFMELTAPIFIVGYIAAVDEKKIKETQNPFVKRIIAGGIVFLIPTIVEAVITFVAPKSIFAAC